MECVIIMRNATGYMPSTNPDRSPLNSVIEELLLDRKRILSYSIKDFAMKGSVCIRPLHQRIELEGMQTPGKLLNKAKTATSIIRRQGTKKEIAMKARANGGDRNDCEISSSPTPESYHKLKDAAFESVSEIKEDEEYSEEFMSAMSQDRSSDLKFQLENIELAEENGKLRRENAQLRLKSETEIQTLREELEKARDQLKTLVSKLD
eukprot:TRINITY_DN16709_c0_g1_i1.p1 TRINITY_DN16709_c0_g1~~TRINITY_DN16709_c0_g1_i1.p1  ORF type:complete len:207 (+),score=49.86 TRINITY_DN16709_c0_g1_i1:31-651(+)